MPAGYFPLLCCFVSMGVCFTVFTSQSKKLLLKQMDMRGVSEVHRCACPSAHCADKTPRANSVVEHLATMHRVCGPQDCENQTLGEEGEDRQPHSTFQ